MKSVLPVVFIKPENFHKFSYLKFFVMQYKLFLNQARAAEGARTWFLEIALVHTSVCVSVYVSVCPPPRALITSGMIWCAIGHVQLVKQVSRLFPAFNYFI